jgi:WD40 repeat protein
MVNCLCQLNNIYIVSGGAERLVEKTKVKDKSIVVWRTDKDNLYIYSQTLKGHKGDVTSLIQLRDGNFASSSADHTIKIWKDKKVENCDYISYEMAYNIEYPHGIYKIIQLEDDRICATSSTFQILFWRNRSGSY